MKDIVNLKDSYSDYTGRVEKPKATEKEYLDIVYGFMKFTVDKVIEGKQVYIASGGSLGSLYIIGTKVTPKLNEDGEIRGLAPDWRKTKELWDNNPKAKEEKRIAYCFNEHSNGIRYRLVWDRKNAKTKNNQIYNLIFTKGPNGVKRKVYKAVKNGMEYVVKVKKEEQV